MIKGGGEAEEAGGFAAPPDAFLWIMSLGCVLINSGQLLLWCLQGRKVFAFHLGTTKLPWLLPLLNHGRSPSSSSSFSSTTAATTVGSANRPSASSQASSWLLGGY